MNVFLDLFQMNKAFVLIIFSSFLFFACTKTRTNRNPYLIETSFEYQVNLNLPQFNALQNIGNPVFIGTQGVGIKGVYIMNTGFDTFRAFEASCPNHVPSPCSRIVAGGDSGTCQCDSYEYSLFTGQLLDRPDGEFLYDLLEYNVRSSASNLYIYN